MLSMLKDWKGKIQINDIIYDSVEQAIEAEDELGDDIHIILITNHKKAKMTPKAKSTEDSEDDIEKQEYRITVKSYMTKESEPDSDFDFMERWNGNNPMPLRTMTGTIDKQTPGMYHMHLHGQGEAVVTCMRCGRPLTNKVSRHYGIGPECMAKLGIVADIEDVENIKKQLVDVEWEGWVIKSAILEMEEI